MSFTFHSRAWQSQWQHKDNTLGSCTPSELPLNQGQCPGIPVPSQPLSSTPSTPVLYHRHSSDSSSADRREKSQPCSNSHAAGAANANRDIGSWMQAWSQWLFCSWHGLCLIGIGHAEWSSGEGYGNAPTESIKWGDTLRPYDGQRINESQRKGSREERSTDRGSAMRISFRKDYKSLPHWTEKKNLRLLCQPCLTILPYLKERLINMCVYKILYEWLLIS